MVDSDGVLNEAVALKARGESFALVTVVRCISPTSAKPGAKAVVTGEGEIRGWIGGGCAQPAVIKSAKRAIADGRSRLIRISPVKGGKVEEGVEDFGMSCHSGGALDIFIDPVVARPVLLVIGASPAAQALVGLARRVGYCVTAAFAGADRKLFPEADCLLSGLDMTDLPVRPAFAVVATQGKRDEEGLEAALASEAPHIAFIASARKADKLRAYLKERGHEPARVDDIAAPAGLPIGAVTPEEIALSVLAEVVRTRRDASEPTAAHSAAANAEDGATSASAIDPVCAMSVDIEGAEQRTEYGGQSYYFCCAGCKHAFDKEPERYVDATADGA